MAGRSVGWSGEQFLRLNELNRDLNGIAVLTFDQLLLRGRETLLLLNERVAAAYRGRINFPGCGFISDEDIPF